jgi:SAM-dependent methyltransferase
MPEIKLNLGCGDCIHKDYVNIDKVKLHGVDLIWDLEKTPLPFKDDSVSEIRVEHVLEHIQNYMGLMNDIHRVSKPNGIINVLAPYYKYEGSYRDPTHVRFFTEHSFDYFQDGVKFSHYCKARFKVLEVERRVRFLSDVKNFQKRLIKVIPNFIRPILNIFLWNIYTELRYKLRVIK